MLILVFISGLALLLFAMKQMEHSLANIGKGQLQRALEQSTRTPFHGVLLGTLVTAILQSSTIVGLMTMAFLGAGVLPFRNAIGIIMGSNLGTTFTGYLVAWLGFKVELDQFYTLLLGAGAVLAVAGRDESRLQETGKLIMAFGFLLFALVLMKDSIGFVLDHVDVAQLQQVSLLAYFLFGLVLTAVIQSSSATMMITLSALSTGILGLEASAAIVIGSKLGTTSTVVLVSLKGSMVKRQIAMVHVVFNLVVSIIGMLALPWLLVLLKDVLQITDPLFDLVVLHSILSLVGIVLFLPCVDMLGNLVERTLPLPARPGLVVEQVSTAVPDAALKAVEADVRALLGDSVLLNAWRLGILQARDGMRKVRLAETAQSSYAELKDHENRLSDYILELQRVALTPEQVRRAQQLLVCIRDCLYSTKAVKDIESDLVRFRLESGVEVKDFINRLLNSVESLFGRTLELLECECEITAEDFKAMREQVHDSHAASNVAIYSLIDQKGFKHDRASSALNINRELLLAAHSLINALQHYLLPGEQAATVSEWLSTRG
jgi:phosphate:Na+ symporter